MEWALCKWSCVGIRSNIHESMTAWSLSKRACRALRTPGRGRSPGSFYCPLVATEYPWSWLRLVCWLDHCPQRSHKAYWGRRTVAFLIDSPELSLGFFHNLDWLRLTGKLIFERQSASQFSQFLLRSPSTAGSNQWSRSGSVVIMSISLTHRLGTG